ncbi:MAG: hypothetical protein KY464_09160 [Gemmatimonadetes bacterium]|nr:hypothetical protein [Gemmatimonadota bacterium]
MIPSALDTNQQPARRFTSDVASVHAEVQRARPNLRSEDPEYRAAVLLLLIHDTGFNVDRLTVRTRFPREFVARCLRRLSDNGWWVDGADTCDWGEERASHEHFWWDVDVALGRRLRRVTGDGERHWAGLDGWVKEFEYAARNAEASGVYNEYRHIPRYNPDPVFNSGPEEEEETVDPPAVARAAAQPRTVSPTPVAAQQPASEQVEWLGAPPQAQTPPAPAASPASSGLVQGWGEVKWLG